MDNLTIGPPVVTSLRKHSEEAFLDCHLMVSEPNKWVQVRVDRPAVCIGRPCARAKSSLLIDRICLAVCAGHCPHCALSCRNFVAPTHSGCWQRS